LDYELFRLSLEDGGLIELSGKRIKFSMKSRVFEGNPRRGSRLLAWEQRGVRKNFDVNTETEKDGKGL
jgi:hypothetical protein